MAAVFKGDIVMVVVATATIPPVSAAASGHVSFCHFRWCVRFLLVEFVFSSYLLGRTSWLEFSLLPLTSLGVCGWHQGSWQRECARVMPAPVLIQWAIVVDGIADATSIKRVSLEWLLHVGLVMGRTQLKSPLSHII